MECEAITNMSIPSLFSKYIYIYIYIYWSASKWTENDQSRLNRIKIHGIGLNRPEWTKLDRKKKNKTDRIIWKKTEWTKVNQIRLNRPKWTKENRIRHKRAEMDRIRQKQTKENRNGPNKTKEDRSGPQWTELDWIGPKCTKWTKEGYLASSTLINYDILIKGRKTILQISWLKTVVV